MSITGISLPLLVRDWVKKRCPTGACFNIQEYYDMKWDPRNCIEEEQVLSNLIVTKRCPGFSEGWTVDVTMSTCSIDTWVSYPSHQGSALVLKTLGNPVTTFLDWKSPSFFRKLGRTLKCRCKTKPT